MKVFSVLDYKASRSMEKAVVEMNPKTWAMLVKHKQTPDKNPNNFTYCRAEDIDKYFDLSKVEDAPVEDIKAQKLQQLEKLQAELSGLGVQVDPLPKPKKEVAPPPKKVESQEQEVDLNAMNEDELRAFAENNDVKLGNTKSIEKIKDKIEAALSA